MSFVGEDLRGIDFTGADLSACDFTDALIVGARFDQAILGQLTHDPDGEPPGVSGEVAVTNLRAARDWPEHYQAWVSQKPKSDADLPVGSLFIDAPFGPLMVVMPVKSSKHSDARDKIAVSRSVISKEEVWRIHQMGLSAQKVRHSNPDASEIVVGDFEIAREYCGVLTAATLHTYEVTPSLDLLAPRGTGAFLISSFDSKSNAELRFPDLIGTTSQVDDTSAQTPHLLAGLGGTELSIPFRITRRLVP